MGPATIGGADVFPPFCVPPPSPTLERERYDTILQYRVSHHRSAEDARKQPGPILCDIAKCYRKNTTAKTTTKAADGVGFYLHTRTTHCYHWNYLLIVVDS